MAIKPTIYKFRISLSDLNRDYYDTLNLTLAQHPSETIERRMVRVVSDCSNAEETLLFTKGLSDVECYEAGGLFRYTYGQASDWESANVLEEEAKAYGYDDAFIVAFYNNKRIGVGESVKLLKQD